MSNKDRWGTKNEKKLLIENYWRTKNYQKKKFERQKLKSKKVDALNTYIIYIYIYEYHLTHQVVCDFKARIIKAYEI